MYILILFQFSVCILAGIGLNHFLNKIKNTMNARGLLYVLLLVFLFIGSIFLYQDSITNFSNKLDNRIQYIREMEQNNNISSEVALFNIKLLERNKVELTKTHVPIQSNLIKTDIVTALIFLILLFSIISSISFINNSQIHWILPILITLISLIDVWIVNYKIIYKKQNI